MTEPKEFQGMQRSELVRLVFRHRELWEQAEAQCERMRLIALQRGERLIEAAQGLGLQVNDDFAGADLVVAVDALVKASILNKEAMEQWEKAAQEGIEWKKKYDHLAQWSTAAAQTLDELPRCADETTRREVEKTALGLVERLPNGTKVLFEECTNCNAVVVPCPDCGALFAHNLGCPRR